MNVKKIINWIEEELRIINDDINGNGEVFILVPQREKLKELLKFIKDK